MKQRSRQRGAAMVEAIVVVMVLLVFLGMITWSARAYGAKIDQASTTRNDVLYWASHSCEQAPPVDDPAVAPSYGGEGDQPVATEGEDPSKAEGLAGVLTGTKNDKVAAAGLTRDWNMASTAREQNVDGSAIVNLERVPLSTHVSTHSWVACNEKNYGGDWNDLAQFVWAMKDNGAGLLGP